MPSHRRHRLAQFFGKKLHTHREVDKAGMGRLRPLRLEICKTLVAHSETGEARRERELLLTPWFSDRCSSWAFQPSGHHKLNRVPLLPVTQLSAEGLFREMINMTVFCFALIGGWGSFCFW